MTTCPGCGAPLTPVDLPDTPPWLCGYCSRGWWLAELAQTVRDRWNPLLRDFGDPHETVDIQAAVDVERGVL